MEKRTVASSTVPFFKVTKLIPPTNFLLQQKK